MKRVAAFICGLILVLLAKTLFSQLGYFLIALGYSTLLAWLFFARRSFQAFAWPFGFGVTIGSELLGSQNFGLYATYLYALYLLVVLFRDQLRFTSPEIRFSIALFLSLVGYDAIFPSVRFATEAWLPLFIILVIFCFGVAIRPTDNTEPLYESL